MINLKTCCIPLVTSNLVLRGVILAFKQMSEVSSHPKRKTPSVRWQHHTRTGLTHSTSDIHIVLHPCVFACSEHTAIEAWFWSTAKRRPHRRWQRTTQWRRTLSCRVAVPCGFGVLVASHATHIGLHFPSFWPVPFSDELVRPLDVWIQRNHWCSKGTAEKMLLALAWPFSEFGNGLSCHVPFLRLLRLLSRATQREPSPADHGCRPRPQDRSSKTGCRANLTLIKTLDPYPLCLVVCFFNDWLLGMRETCLVAQLVLWLLKRSFFNNLSFLVLKLCVNLQLFWGDITKLAETVIRMQQPEMANLMAPGLQGSKPMCVSMRIQNIDGE